MRKRTYAIAMLMSFLVGCGAAFAKSSGAALLGGYTVAAGDAETTGQTLASENVAENVLLLSSGEDSSFPCTDRTEKRPASRNKGAVFFSLTCL